MEDKDHILQHFKSHQSGRLFERTRSMDNLNRAVQFAEMTVDSTPHGHRDRAHCLDNLGNHLRRRFERTGSMTDLNRAVEVASMAVDATPKDHPNRSHYLNNLSN